MTKTLTSADSLFSRTTGSFSLVSERETDLSLPQHNLDSSLSWAMGATLAWAGDDPNNNALDQYYLKHYIYHFHLSEIKDLHMSICVHACV
jgi:hypothetical protein